ncbi:response regulator [Salinimicrobium sp. GXAS 041]|uniref:response regulator n=1 Tax=Salinimicrobium sp. GXAS 041 TaxID=3400806 RepID=UPI003C774D98
MSKIYLIDDQPIGNFIAKKLLEIEGFEENVHDFTNPVEAFEIVKTEKGTALIFLDLNMPQMNGWQFLDQMQLIGLDKKVIILTSSTSELDRQKAREYPFVVDFVIKPLNRQKFTELATHLNLLK